MAKNERLQRQRIQRNWRQIDVADQIGVALITIQRWERGSQQPSAYYRVKLCSLFGLSAEELGLLEELLASEEGHEMTTTESSPNSPEENEGFWTIPYLRNPHFTGREDLLAQLKQQFAAGESNSPVRLPLATLTQAQAIKGLGGIGKTQTAIEYAYRAFEQGRYTHTIWVDAASEEVILACFAALVEFLPAWSAQGESDQRKLAQAVIRWLEGCPQPWLFIGDNADDLDVLQPYLPVKGNGHILLTTRAGAVGSLASSITVDIMDLNEATQLLLRRANRLKSASEREIDEAGQIARALGQFPLALDQAGAYIEETGCSLAEYRELYQDHQLFLLSRRGKQASGYPESVATTWFLSFQKVEQANPAAAVLLHLCAFQAPEHIPEELLTKGAPHWPDLLQSAVKDRLRFNQTLESLLAFSLIRRLPEEHFLSIHRLVQVVLREGISPEEQRAWAERLVLAVHAVFPHDFIQNTASWPQCQRYLEQVQACDALIEQYDFHFLAAAVLLERTATYLQARAIYTLAEPLYLHALQIYEHLGKDQERPLVKLLHNFALNYERQGKYALAETYFSRALNIHEQLPEAEYLDMANALCGLGTIYFHQVKYAEAEALYLRALHIREQHGGFEHLDVADSFIHLGNLYYMQGKFTEAERLYQQALQIRQQQLGPTHHEVARAFTSLAAITIQQGKYEQAAAFNLEALHIYELQGEGEHPDAAVALSNLAISYSQQEKFEQSEEIYHQVLKIRKKQLDPEHPFVATALHNLAEVYSLQKKYDLAEPLYQQALQAHEHKGRSEHMSTAFSLTGLATLYTFQGKYEQAEPLYQRALEICKYQTTSEHPQVALPLSGLATLFFHQGKYKQAEAFYQRSLAIREQNGEMEDLDTARMLADFARLQQVQGKPAEALSLYQSSLALREQILRPEHPLIIETRQRLDELLALNKGL